MGVGPDLKLLANGDILVPVKEAGAWRVSRVAPDDAEYARWLRELQRRTRRPGLLARGLTYWLCGWLVVIAVPAVALLLALLVRAVS